MEDGGAKAKPGQTCKPADCQLSRAQTRRSCDSVPGHISWVHTVRLVKLSPATRQAKQPPSILLLPVSSRPDSVRLFASQSDRHPANIHLALQRHPPREKAGLSLLQTNLSNQTARSPRVAVSRLPHAMPTDRMLTNMTFRRNCTIIPSGLSTPTPSATTVAPAIPFSHLRALIFAEQVCGF